MVEIVDIAITVNRDENDLRFVLQHFFSGVDIFLQHFGDLKDFGINDNTVVTVIGKYGIGI